MGKDTKSDYVFFSDTNNKPVMIQPMRQELQRIVNAIHADGIDDFPDSLVCHELRHTFITHSIREGMPPTVLQKLVGHANIQIIRVSSLLTYHNTQIIHKTIFADPYTGVIMSIFLFHLTPEYYPGHKKALFRYSPRTKKAYLNIPDRSKRHILKLSPNSKGHYSQLYIV